MSSMRAQPSESDVSGNPLVRVIGGVCIAIAALIVVGLGLLVAGPVNSPVHQAFNALFAIDSVQALWYVTRASGIIAFLLLWLSTVWGLALSNKILSPVLQAIFSFDFHEILSLLAIGFTVLHMGVLLFDPFMPFSLAQILVPGVSTYRNAWVGIGIIGFYLMLLVTVTFYTRRFTGHRTFKVLHYLSYVSYLGVTLHSIFTGTDSVLPAAMLMYAGTFLVVVFMTVYRIALALQDRSQKRAQAEAAALAQAQQQARNQAQAWARQTQARSQLPQSKVLPNGTRRPM